LTVIPDDNSRSDGEKVPHHYSTSVGVRKGEAVLLKALERALAKRKSDVEALLQAEGIPLLPVNESRKTASLNP
jgi:mxaJ protein